MLGLEASHGAASTSGGSIRLIIEMNYSIRDLMGLSFFAALMVAPNFLVTMCVISTSLTAFAIASLAFVQTTFRSLTRSQTSNERFRLLAPFAVLFTCCIAWPLLLRTLTLVSLDQETKIRSAMLMSVVASSIPILLIVDLKRRVLDDWTVGICCYTASVGSFVAGTLLAVLQKFSSKSFGLFQSSCDLQIGVRIALVCGMLAVVTLIWKATSKRDINELY